MSELIDRQAAIDAIKKHLNGVFDGTHYDEGIAYGYEAAHRHIQEVINALPSAQPEQDDSSEIWRKRAEQYRDMCFDLVNKINQGIKVDSIAISEDGIVFKASPSAQQWIPVSERLPEEAQDVLVTVNDGAIYVETDYFTGAHFLKFWDDTTAWMPLPEPWKGGEADV